VEKLQDRSMSKYERAILINEMLDGHKCYGCGLPMKGGKGCVQVCINCVSAYKKKKLEADHLPKSKRYEKKGKPIKRKKL